MFQEISAKNMEGNVMKMIADEWMLVAAGDETKCNMMTASWGFMGEMWGKECAMIVIRPTRYTYDFLENSDYFSLSFYGGRRDIYKICGSTSGRDVDKIKETGLTPVFANHTVYFEEARLVVICKKLYAQDLDPACIVNDDGISKWYNNDYHRAYWGAIQTVLVKE